MLLPALQETVEKIRTEHGAISKERKALIESMAVFISAQITQEKPVNLNFICTHNSRRSHIAQLWAQTAAYHYSVADVHCFSGGTQATAFNPRAVTAMREAGFEITQISSGDNPHYLVSFSNQAPPVKAFSKRYDAGVNPNKNFAAIMTCSHADENCPLIPGATKRIALTYDDPKDFDNTPLEGPKYRERVMEIGREIFFAFSKVKQKAPM